MALRGCDDLIPSEIFRQRAVGYIVELSKIIGAADTHFRQVLLQNLMIVDSLYVNPNRTSTVVIDDESVVCQEEPLME